MDEHIAAIINKAIREHVFPGAVVGYSINGAKSIAAFGSQTYDNQSPRISKDDIFDLASITKSIPTASLIHILIEQGRLSLNDKIASYIPELTNKYRNDITIRHLLTFTAIFDTNPLSEMSDQGVSNIINYIYNAPLKSPPGQDYEYANIPAILLGIIIERCLNKRLDVAAQELLFDPLKMTATTFHPPKKSIPTEVDKKGIIQGIVHDETARTFHREGVVSGHAGLFSNANDLLTYGEAVMASFHGNAHLFTRRTIESFYIDQIGVAGEAAGLGWEIKDDRFMGVAAAQACFGKIGFTGTMIMIHPERRICLVLLSNRTYPVRAEDSSAIHRVRSQVADIVFSTKE